MKLRHLAAFFVAIASFASPAWAQGEAETIACPDQGVEVNITAGLPEGWSSAAVGVRLTASEVRAEGDAVALVCLYDPAGAIAQEMPEQFEDCAPAPGGFECTAIEPGRLVARGRAILPERAGFDLDTGTEQVDRRLNDIWFTGTAEGNPVLETFNNTTFSVVPADRPARLITCQEGRYDLTRVAIGLDVPVGGAVCYQTDEGRFGMFNVVRSNETEVRLRFRTIR
jgi:hypothetical protein